MIKINDYATKNHLNEWEIKDLPENDVYRLDLQDLGLLFSILINSDIEGFESELEPKWVKLFICGFVSLSDKMISELRMLAHCKKIELILLDLQSSSRWINADKIITNIIPDWSKYIAEYSAVLFLNEADYNKYKNLYPENYPTERAMFNKNQKFFIKNNKIPYLTKRVPSHICDWGDYTKVSIILPSIHSQNIQEINDIAKDLKENYGVEYVEVVATHCFTFIGSCTYADDRSILSADCGTYRLQFIDKIITTNSVNKFIKVQKYKRLEVIDCEEFFN